MEASRESLQNNKQEQQQLINKQKRKLQIPKEQRHQQQQVEEGDYYRCSTCLQFKGRDGYPKKQWKLRPDNNNNKKNNNHQNNDDNENSENGAASYTMFCKICWHEQQKVKCRIWGKEQQKATKKQPRHF